MADLYAALIHYPVLNKNNSIITTAVTNFDLHDLSRNSRTYDVKRLFIVTPNEIQLGMVNYIRDYWVNGHGAAYNPDRKEAFGILESKKNLEEVCLTIKELSGKNPLLVATTAKNTEKSVGYSVVKEKLKQDRPVLLAFGTGYGLVPGFLEAADYVLEPIRGAGQYNHLPVRSAVAVILDRLLARDDASF
ncbi:MAG: RNA methyltransferase [Deltaproteobacteria bacterium]|nr:RNA methyltransferase [Deltaproteobacteria bacterium]